MRDNLPPGAAGDADAPFNQPPAAECETCDERIVTSDDHDPECEYNDLDSAELTDLA